jgi:predicted nucleic acid-binding protein
MKVGLDTNFLFYADGFDDDLRRDKASDLLSSLPAIDVFIPIQVIAEFYHTVLRKRQLNDGDAEWRVFMWTEFYSTIETNHQVIVEATELRRKHKLQVFDAIVLAACALAGCSILLSEDMQHGFQWHGCTIVNPFHDPMHPLLLARLNNSSFS